jgi:site-specific DNA recombinase
VHREDAAALKGLGFTASDLAELGLDRPTVGCAEQLLDVYIRRSKKREDLATLRAHLRDVVLWARAEGLGVRHVWFEQRSARQSVRAAG